MSLSLILSSVRGLIELSVPPKKYNSLSKVFKKINPLPTACMPLFVASPYLPVIRLNWKVEGVRPYNCQMLWFLKTYKVSPASYTLSVMLESLSLPTMMSIAKLSGFNVLDIANVDDFLDT